MSQSDFFRMVANEKLKKLEFDEIKHLPPEKATHEFKYPDLDIELRFSDASKAGIKKNFLEPWNYEVNTQRNDISEIIVIDRSKQQIIARLEFK